MSSLLFFQPASEEEALALLAASPLTVDSPTQRRIRTERNLRDYLGSGRRRPEWVWAVRYDDDPAPLGVIGGFGSPEGRLHCLDLFGLPADPAAAGDLVAHATRAAVTEGADEALLFAPAGSTLDDPALANLVRPLRDAGWRLLVERRHYEFEPPPDLGDDAPDGLAFERPTDAEDPRLAACHREIMRETLDAHDRELVERLGFERACRDSLAYLLDEAPADTIHLATDEAGEVVGLVSGVVFPNRRAVVTFVGVGREHRGHGYGRRLLAWQTRRLLAAGAEVLIGDTDNANVPMASAFADVGWPQTETRIDLVPV